MGWGPGWRVTPNRPRGWSAEQVADWLARQGELSIRHEPLYRYLYVWSDRAQGGDLHRHLRCAAKKRRKRHGRYDSRGRLAGKRLGTAGPKIGNVHLKWAFSEAAVLFPRNDPPGPERHWAASLRFKASGSSTTSSARATTPAGAHLRAAGTHASRA